MRYCPNCNKIVGERMTVGQVFLMLFLFSLFIFPGLIYLGCRRKLCPICATETIGFDDKITKK